MAKAKRQYDNEFPSVTQILDVLRKVGLEMWFKFNTIEFITKESSKGKLIGTQIHEAIESYITTGTAKIETEYDVEVTNALKSFMLFRAENPSINLMLSESPLTSLQYGFNGTIDAPCPPNLCDWKSGKKGDKDKPPIYDEYKFQVAAYVHLWNENNPDNQIVTAYIVAIAKDAISYNMYKMDKVEIDECFNEVFLPALKILTYQKRKK